MNCSEKWLCRQKTANKWIYWLQGEGWVGERERWSRLCCRTGDACREQTLGNVCITCSCMVNALTTKQSQSPVAQSARWARDLWSTFVLSNEVHKPTIAAGVLLKSLKMCGTAPRHSRWADPESHAWSLKSKERWSIRLNVYPDPIWDMNQGSASAEPAAESVRPLTMN